MQTKCGPYLEWSLFRGVLKHLFQKHWLLFGGWLLFQGVLLGGTTVSPNVNAVFGDLRSFLSTRQLACLHDNLLDLISTYQMTDRYFVVSHHTLNLSDLKRQCMANVNNSNVYIYKPKNRSV